MISDKNLSKIGTKDIFFPNDRIRRSHSLQDSGISAKGESSIKENQKRAGFAPFFMNNEV